MDKESRGFREELLRLTWFMRGGVSFNEILQMTVRDRESISNIIKDNMETTKKSRLPFF